MLILKFTKTENSSLVSHVDNLRAVTHIFRRAKVAVEYSKGYNPHMELGFSAPISLGIESVAEYVSAKAEMQDDILAKLNANCPKGMSFVALYEKKVNLAATLNRAEYILTANGIGDVIEQILTPGYTISYLEKREMVSKDVSNKIFFAERIDQNNANSAKFMKKCFAEYGDKIVFEKSDGISLNAEDIGYADGTGNLDIWLLIFVSVTVILWTIVFVLKRKTKTAERRKAEADRE